MYDPLPPECVLKNSKIHGLGLFVIKNVPNNHDFGIGHIKDKEFKDGYIRFLRLFSIREIKAGEELTAFYTLYQP